MKSSSLWIILLGALFLSSCDDEESTSNVPPDLKLEDVVGCWYSGGDGYCEIECFDPIMMRWYQSFDSSRLYTFESTSSYHLSGHFVVGERLDANSKGYRSESHPMEMSMKRRGDSLCYLGGHWDVISCGSSVNLDSTLPCGTPFLLLPKPEGWTLF